MWAPCRELSSHDFTQPTQRRLAYTELCSRTGFQPVPEHRRDEDLADGAPGFLESLHGGPPSATPRQAGSLSYVDGTTFDGRLNCIVPASSHLDLQRTAFDSRAAQPGEDDLRVLGLHINEQVALADIDDAHGAGRQAGLAKDRAHDIAGADTHLGAEVHPELRLGRPREVRRTRLARSEPFGAILEITRGFRALKRCRWFVRGASNLAFRRGDR